MKIAFIIPGDINLPTGGYRYDKEIINAWENSGVEVELISLEGNYPFPSEKEKQSAIDSIKDFPKADIAIVDGLLGGASPNFLKALSQRMPVSALIHHPLCLENGLDADTAKGLETSERHGLEFVENIVTTSPATAKTVAKLFNFDATKIHTVLPGVTRAEISRGSQNSTVNLLCVGSLIERKGHRFLLEALSQLNHLDWRLDCYGSTDFDTKLFAELTKMLETSEHSDKIKFHGAVSDTTLEAAYLNADIFVLPSLYEGYGMVYAEAIVRGLPIIATRAGAIPQTVPETCGILVEPENIEMLKQAIEELISDKELREQYRKAAIREEPNFPTWQKSAHQFAAILKEAL